MLGIIKKILLCIVNDIDAGNSNLSEEDCLKVINLFKEYVDKDIEFSKYQAYTYLNKRRAQFDNLVREGKLPKGKKVAGFKELRWSKKELDEYVRRGNKKTNKGKQSYAERDS